MDSIHKYPRTTHIEGSGLAPGDDDQGTVPFSDIGGLHLVVEEKIDGANSAVSFSPDRGLMLQSRGHFLTGGYRERHFDLLKTWATRHAGALRDVLATRYVMYGEWVYAKHTVYYDALPHFFLEFDILDTVSGNFLSTGSRREMLDGLPVQSVPVIHAGPVADLESLQSLIGPSAYKSPTWFDNMIDDAGKQGLSVDHVRAQTDASDLMEGLYVKVETEERVTARYKFVRSGFLQTVIESDSHWQSRPILANRLARGVDLFADK